MVQYYGEKYYDDTKSEYIDNLRDIWTNRINYIFNDEYLRTKRAKENKLETIMNRLSELEQNNKSETMNLKIRRKKLLLIRRKKMNLN